MYIYVYMYICIFWMGFRKVATPRNANSNARPHTLFQQISEWNVPVSNRRQNAVHSKRNESTTTQWHKWGATSTSHPPIPRLSSAKCCSQRQWLKCVWTWCSGVKWTLEHVEIHTPKESKVLSFVLKFSTTLIGCEHWLCLWGFDPGHATDKSRTSVFREESLFPWSLWGCLQVGHLSGPI